MKTQRQTDIRELTQKMGSVSLDELCRIFNVSKNTIRRDINELAKDGLVEKVYGGIKAVDNQVISYTQRDVTNKNAKNTIASLAASRIQNGDIIFIDSGTTTAQMVDFFSENISCTIITNNFDVIKKCVDFPNIILIVIGSLYKQTTRSFISLNNEINVSHYNITKSFMACTGFSIEAGLTNTDPYEHAIKKIICEKASEIHILADSSKYEKPTLLTYCRLENIDYFITDATPPTKYVNFFKENDVQVLTD